MAELDSIVIVGGGQAGARAAQAMRDNGYRGRLVMIAEERHPPYQRPPLSKAALTGDDDFAHVRIHEPGYYAEAGIELVHDPVVAIDRPRRSVRLGEGATFAYDRLLIATGARVRTLDLPGVHKAGVYYLRT